VLEGLATSLHVVLLKMREVILPHRLQAS
jgi:hypothetical protein